MQVTLKTHIVPVFDLCAYQGILYFFISFKDKVNVNSSSMYILIFFYISGDLCRYDLQFCKDGGQIISNSKSSKKNCSIWRVQLIFCKLAVNKKRPSLCLKLKNICQVVKQQVTFYSGGHQRFYDKGPLILLCRIISVECYTYQTKSNTNQNQVRT